MLRPERLQPAADSDACAVDDDVEPAEALADLQRISFEYGISLPTSFALVGKTLAQADSIARVLDPELDPIALLEDDALEVMLGEAERRLEPNQFFAWSYTQLEPLARLPRHLSQLVNKLEAGTVKVGIVPADLEGLEDVLRSVANRVGAALIVVGLLIASALMARVSHVVSLIGFCIAGVMALYLFWRIMRTPGSV